MNLAGIANRPGWAGPGPHPSAMATSTSCFEFLGQTSALERDRSMALVAGRGYRAPQNARSERREDRPECAGRGHPSTAPLLRPGTARPSLGRLPPRTSAARPPAPAGSRGPLSPPEPAARIEEWRWSWVHLVELVLGQREGGCLNLEVVPVVVEVEVAVPRLRPTGW